MNEFLDLLSVPAERDLPSGRLAQRSAALVQFVAADLQMNAVNAARPSRMRALRAWLTSLGVMLALVAVAGSTLLATHHVRRGASRVSVETAVALGSGSVVASFVTLPRRGSSVSTGGASIVVTRWMRVGSRAPGRVSFPGLTV